MAGAWICYRAVLRAVAHGSRRENFQQSRVNLHSTWLRTRLAAWAADPRTTIPQLQAALGEAIKAEPRSDWDSYALKIRYIHMLSMLDGPMRRTFGRRSRGNGPIDWAICRRRSA